VKAVTIGFLAAACAVSAPAVEIDGIAAKVGDVTILRSDVKEEMRYAGADETRYAEFCNRAVERKLILRAAGESKMTMQEWVVENRVREVIQRNFDGDRNKLMEMLARQKISYPEWYAKLREDMIVGAMRWNVVDKNIIASPSAMKAEYKAHPERYRAGRKTTVSVIMLRPEDAPKRTHVLSALTKEPFADVARKYSVDEKAAAGGVWKDIEPADAFKPEVCEAIGRLKVGETSKWIDIDGWSFLIRKDGVSDGRVQTFEEAFDAIEKNVKDAAADAAYAAWIERLKDDVYIKVY